MPTEAPALAYDESSAPFFEAAARGELLLQYCAACEKFMWPVKYRCIHCFAPDVEWRVASGRARLHSLTVVHQTYPGFDEPYVVATVETHEGVRFNTGLVGDDVESTPIGAELVVDIDPTGQPFPDPEVQESQMSYESVRYEKQDHVAVVTLDRPQSMNALHLEAHLELKEIWEDFRDDPDLWVAILTGAGDRAFCAGNDLKVTAERTADGTDVRGVERPPFGRITRDFDCPKPMIAALNGVAAGGGLELALACDIVVAADHARLGLPEPKVGLFAGAGGAHRLARQLPFKVAMGMLLTGDLIDAAEAHRIGLVNQVVPAADLMATAHDWADRIIRCSPVSLQLTKEAVFDAQFLSIDEAFRADDGRRERLFASHDFVEGPRAFAEKRTPQWTGR